MKKALICIAGALVLVLLSQMLFISKIDKTIVEETYQYCKKNGYSTDYCFFVDFSKPSGINRFFIYSFKEKKIIHRSLCAQGLGPQLELHRRSCADPKLLSFRRNCAYDGASAFPAGAPSL